MKVDYIIVGLGLAGLAFAEELQQANKTFIVFEDDSQTSSLVAGGVYNPVNLRRFTPVWNAAKQLDIAMPFYKKLEEKLHLQLDKKIVIKRAFKSLEEQNNWFEASDKPLLKRFLNLHLDKTKVAGVLADVGFGIVNETGRVDTLQLVTAYRNFLKENNLIRFEQFDHQQLEVSKSTVNYKDISSSKVVFCEGYGVKQNPFFKYLPLQEVKGELLTIHAPELQIDFLLKSTLFLIPLGDHYYKVGATFNHSDKTSKPSDIGRQELIEKLTKVINVPYTIIDQTAGIRPATKGRKPFVGVHEEFNNLAILNGLGTRGVMIAPTLAKNLYLHLEYNEPLDTDADIKRFANK
ncbi:NAD(P)/FAD-dependent oxidoreductase [Polaribacter tangerinus]|uniref:NAD(P)/FAD-dependent oxidoreductase n=1 Tax=Polaribacter tangerinus TaxID=1920034 RepID=UPI000B4BBB95|nr:FAD-binding oxidoreductase [Polaribacter tangerinus]